MELKLILNDSTEITLFDADFINGFSTICQTQEEIIYLWNKLSIYNTQQVKIKLGDEIIQVISDVQVTGYQVKENFTNHNFFVTFFYTGASFSRDIQKQYNDVAKILLGEEDF